MSLSLDLASLPPPQIIEEIDYEALLALTMQNLVGLFAAAGITYDVGELETDPAKILLEVDAYVDVNLRQRINEAIRSNLLPYATGADLDILAGWYGVTRLFEELDAPLRERVVLAIRGRSLGGTEPSYLSIVRNADLRVADAAIYQIGNDPSLYIAVFSTDNNGVADQALLDTVLAALNDPARRIISDRFVVAAASRQTINIEANVWLLPNTPDSVLTDMSAALTAAWAKDMLLGRDVTQSWLSKALHLEGVSDIQFVSPTGNVTMPSHEAAALGTITLNKTGRNF